MENNEPIMGAYNHIVISGDPSNYRRNLERQKRARAKKREQVWSALRKAGYIKCEDDVWRADTGQIWS